MYKKFLETCENEVTGACLSSLHFAGASTDRLRAEDTPLASAALHCLCQLVREKPDFNFAVNIMDVIVKRVGRKGWDDVTPSSST